LTFGLAGFAAFLFLFLFFWDVCWAPCEDCCSPVLVPAGSGVLAVPVLVVLVDEEEEGPEPLCEGEVEVEVDVECVGALEEVEELGAAEVVVVVVVLVVTPADGVLVVEGSHCSFSETITPCTGSPMAEMGVPGATLTWKT
jgi:hypothetical protein